MMMMMVMMMMAVRVEGVRRLVAWRGGLICRTKLWVHGGVRKLEKVEKARKKPGNSNKVYTKSHSICLLFEVPNIKRFF
jgi:hypothetical protein